VRDQAFKAVELFMKRLETHVATMPETVLQPAAVDATSTPMAYNAPQTSIATGSSAAIVSSAAGAAGALAGWAISSLGKKLAAADMQSTMDAQAAIAPVPTSGSANGHLGVTPAPNIGTSSSASSLSKSFNPPPPTFNLQTKPAARTKPSTPSSSRPVHVPLRKGLQLGATKIQSGLPAALEEELQRQEEEVEAFDEDEIANAWGEPAEDDDAVGGGEIDLMDVNADADDWSAFETAPASSDSAVPPRVHITPEAPTRGRSTDDNPWSETFTASTNPTTPPSMWQSSPNLATSSSTSSPAASTRSSSILATAPSPPKIEVADSDGWTASWGDEDAGSSDAKKEQAAAKVLTKEEKAAEMARRREERKQRIAQLKQASGKS